MKVHVRFLMKDSTSIGEVVVSFFNELDTKKRTMLITSGFDSQTSVSFFNELATKKKTMFVTSVSFLNDIDTETRTFLDSGFNF